MTTGFNTSTIWSIRVLIIFHYPSCSTLFDMKWPMTSTISRHNNTVVYVRIDITICRLNLVCYLYINPDSADVRIVRDDWINTGAVVTICTVHYSEVIMGTMASQITSLAIVYTTDYSSADQRKHQSSASLAFVRGIHRWPVNSPHKWPVTRNFFHVMTSSCSKVSAPMSSNMQDKPVFVLPEEGFQSTTTSQFRAMTESVYHFLCLFRTIQHINGLDTIKHRRLNWAISIHSCR